MCDFTSSAGLDTTAALHKKIWDTFFESSVQQLAYDTIITELLKGDLEWVRQQENGPALTPLNPQPPVHSRWIQFIKDFVLQACLYGYVIYRLGDHKDYEIAPAAQHLLNWQQAENRWKIVAVPGAHGSRRHTRHWKLAILNAPQQYTLHGTTTYRPVSAGARALKDTLQLLAMEEAMRRRDEYNSTPSVFTQVSKSITSTGEGKRPWFRPAALPQFDNTTAPDAPQDFNALVEDRAEAIQRLDDITELSRARARDKYDSGAEIPRVGAAGQAKRRRIEHREMIVSDGREAHIAPYLRAPEHHIATMQKHENRIMFAWGVPPQVIGQNINTERTAASNRLSDMAISGFESHLKLLRNVLQAALCALTPIDSHDKNVFLRPAPCVNAYTLSQLEGILTEQSCAELYSCVYQVPLQFIDRKALRQRQLAINMADSAKGRVENTTASDGPVKNRPAMPEAKKDARAIAKSKGPTTEKA